MSQKIIVDTCGWVAIIYSNINFELELERIFGNYQLVLTNAVVDELYRLEDTRPRGKSLLLAMLEQKSTVVDVSELSYTDDQIFRLAENRNYAVLTIDKILKRRLYQCGITVVEVAKSNHLRLIEGL